MFASIRFYQLRGAATAEVAEPVEAEFADRIAAQPGFVWYALIDCVGGELLTISVFGEREQASGSRELSRHWTEDRLGSFDLTLIEALNGSIPVSRAAPALLEPGSGRYARVRRYKLGDAEFGEVVWRIVDTGLAERIAKLDGFVAYFVFGSGTGELVSASVFRDQPTALASDEVAAAFVAEQLADSLGQATTESIAGGAIVVSRVTDALLEPIHA